MHYITAQQLKGKVLDRDTNTPLEDVNIYFKSDTSTGTVSDEDGVFKLDIKNHDKTSDDIVFSVVGYTSLEYTIEEVKSRNYILFLNKKNEDLDEVLVVADYDLRPELIYKKMTPLTWGVHHFGAVLVADKIYVFGGDRTAIIESEKQAMEQALDMDEFFKMLKSKLVYEQYSDKLQVYDIAKDSIYFSDLELKKRAYHEAVAINNTVYVLGGKSLSRNKLKEYLQNDIEVVDLDYKQLKIDNTYPHQAINFAAVAYQDNVIVMGGSTSKSSNNKKTFSNKSYIYNTTSGYWYELAKMTSAKEVNAVLVNNNVYLIGGFNTKALATIEYYNIKTGNWHTVGEMFTAMENPALTHFNNVIYIFNDDTLLTYNTVTHVLNSYKTNLDVFNASLFYNNGKLFLVGGLTNYNYTISPASKIYQFDLRDLSRTQIIETKVLH
ncbi:Kelch repeat-containing protein [Formosa sediminum]|nr:carboxypeptidase-like regulatory domain-containing protein [Formosa sediminum]